MKASPIFLALFIALMGSAYGFASEAVWIEGLLARYRNSTDEFSELGNFQFSSIGEPPRKAQISLGTVRLVFAKNYLQVEPALRESKWFTVLIWAGDAIPENESWERVKLEQEQWFLRGVLSLEGERCVFQAISSRESIPELSRFIESLTK